MPMYEYACSACRSQFERLRRSDQTDTDIQCPDCGSAKVARKLSLFASVSRSADGSTQPVAGGGGGCCGGGGGMCGCSSSLN